MQIRSWAWAAGPIVIGGVLLIVAPSHWPGLRGVSFLLVLALLAVELAVIGLLVNKRLSGAFIDNRNRLSLSKLQAAAWTVVVLAAFATAAAFNAVAPGVDYSSVKGLIVNIPGELLLAMGISATSLVATPALLSLKSDEKPSARAVTAAAATAVAKPGTPSIANGKVAVRANPAEASWADLVTGDEIGNAASPDLGKIQQVFITLVLLAAYTGYIYQNFVAGPPTTLQLPDLDKSFIWLLGISHASYLAYKAAPHTESAPP